MKAKDWVKQDYKFKPQQKTPTKLLSLSFIIILIINTIIIHPTSGLKQTGANSISIYSKNVFLSTSCISDRGKRLDRNRYGTRHYTGQSLYGLTGLLSVTETGITERKYMSHPQITRIFINTD